MVDYKLIGKRIKLYRTKQGLTHEQVAERIDITTVYLSKIENGHAKPTLDLFASICGAIGCELPSLFCDTTPDSKSYQCEKVLELFRACAPEVKPIALTLLEELSKLQK